MCLWTGHVVVTRRLGAALLLVILTLATIPTAGAQDVECCDPQMERFHLIGEGAAGSMTPFSDDLGDEASTVTLSGAIPQEQEVASWQFTKGIAGTIPAGTWTFEIPYSLENAGGAQVNATVEISISGRTFSGENDPGSSLLAPPGGSVTVDVDVEEVEVLRGAEIEVRFIVSSVVFTLPTGEVGLTFSWGSQDDDATLDAAIPLIELRIERPNVEGDTVQVQVLFRTNLDNRIPGEAASVSLRVQGQDVTTDPVKTARGAEVIWTWSWTGSSTGEQNLSFAVTVNLRQGGPSYDLTTSYVVNIGSTGSGPGVFYPSEEPLRTDGSGSRLRTDISLSMGREDGRLLLERTTGLEFTDEVAYWMRWGMDHMGNTSAELSQPLRTFSGGVILPEEHENRRVDASEVTEFESQMESLLFIYLQEGLHLEADELLGGTFVDFERIDVDLDLGSSTAVDTTSVRLTIVTTTFLDPGTRMNLLRNFILPQTQTVYDPVELRIDATSSGTTSFTSTDLTGAPLDHGGSRSPGGDRVWLTSETIDASTTFSFTTIVGNDPVQSPLGILGILFCSLIAGGAVLLRMTRRKRRTGILASTLLVPVVGGTYVLGYDAVLIYGGTAVTFLLGVIAAILAPRRTNLEAPVEVPCPACSAVNRVEDPTRPLDIACIGCGRTLKLVDQP